jgi:hypothetical protein
MSQVSFSYKNTRRGIILALLAAILLLVSVVIFGVNPNRPSPAQGIGGLQYPATLTAMANSCGDIYYNPPIDGNFGVIQDEFYELNKDKPELNIPVHQQMVVPMFGYMDKESFSDADIRFYDAGEVKGPINRERLLRTMYDKDITVIWYTAETEPSDVSAIKAYTVDNPGKVLAYPWYSTTGKLVGNRTVGFATWGISQTCGLYNEDIVKEFVDFAKENRVDRPTEIPEARMNDQGTLFPIRSNIQN